ncbi:tryptophan synthase subunit alpha [Kitasatospora sp. NPDC058444]|uniref:tryptophan synthase subunit alpha n=1 Tax=Kitasatospora sp. NPDC058444 TaxID=3346504 RepID=UPI00365B49CF
MDAPPSTPSDRPDDRLGRCLNRLDAARQRALTIYLTLGDPLTSDRSDLALAAVDAGADILEFGLPTPNTRPRGAEIARSFERARGTDQEQSWEWLGELRRAAPDLPLLLLVYPETVADLGWDRLLSRAAAAGVDALVLARPDGPDDLERIAAAGLSAVPGIAPAADPALARRLESAAAHLTYRNLAERTGADLDLAAATRLTRRLGETAARPFLVGFGIRDEEQIRAFAPDAAGVVIGSRLISVLARTEPAARPDALRQHIGRWKAATLLDGSPSER